MCIGRKQTRGQKVEDIRIKAINNLIKRRNVLSAQYDQLLTEPESYSIVGSVSVTNRKLETLRKEIKACDEKIEALCAGRGGLAGIQIKIPDYRCPYIHITEELNGDVQE